jgi:hypothetical protein
MALKAFFDNFGFAGECQYTQLLGDQKNHTGKGSSQLVVDFMLS